MQGFIDAYAILGVDPGIDDDALKRAHRALVRTHHPDLQPPERRAAATRRIQEINVAYGLVRDPATRVRYDRLRAAHAARERAAAPVRRAERAVRDADRAVAEADRTAAAQWDAALSSAGAWAGRWWRQHRFRVAHGAARVRRAGSDLVGRVLWLASCAIWLVVGMFIALGAQRFLDIASYLPASLLTLTGAGLGVLIGHRRGWRRRLRLAGMPADSAHRLRGPAELAAAGAALAVVGGVLALVT